jgi:hypothetical protein
MLSRNGVCFYIGDFNPPTRYHLDVAKWLSNKENITEVCIVLGKDAPGEISQQQKADLWDIFFKTEPTFGLRYHKAKNANSMVEVYNLLSEQPDMVCHLALDEKAAKNKKLSEYFEPFQNYEIEIIPSQYRQKSKKMMDAFLNGDKNIFNTMLPLTCSKDQQKRSWEIMDQSAKKEDNESYDELTERYANMFSDSFWKTVLKLK